MKDYFKGMYFKCQSDTQTLAVIPSIHEIGGKRIHSLQIITEDGAWNIEDVTVCGSLCITNRVPLKYDIMGPFGLIPFMECRHSVYSMLHRVNGSICIDDKKYVFENAYGYWEGDSGRSFPKEYAWTHSFIEGKEGVIEGSLMLSVADIPLAGLHFAGIIGIVFWKGKEYRFATYLGARVVQNSNGVILIRQGSMEFEARLIEQKPHPLQAPVNGAMARTIHENITCKAFYRFRINGVTEFAFETDRASFEYEYEWRKLC